MKNLKLEMENPWREITYENRILEIDKEIVESHNEKYWPKLNMKYFPEPFIGNPNGSIYFLLANPGEGGESEIDELNKSPYSEEILKNLRHEKLEYPFYYLNEKWANKGGYNWWTKCLIKLKDNPEISIKTLANELFAVEILGYHSERCPDRVCKANKFKLPSIEYTQTLMRKAIAQKKLIILGRAVGKWFDLVPELKTYEGCFFLAKNRVIEITQNTLSPAAWMKLMQILCTPK